MSLSQYQFHENLPSGSKVISGGTRRQTGVLWIFVALARSEPACIGPNGKHLNHYTTEATVS
jgi:hypothetical protein